MTKLPSQCHKSLDGELKLSPAITPRQRKSKSVQIRKIHKMKIYEEGRQHISTTNVNSVLKTSTVYFLNEWSNPEPVNLLLTQPLFPWPGFPSGSGNLTMWRLPAIVSSFSREMALLLKAYLPSSHYYFGHFKNTDGIIPKIVKIYIWFNWKVH